MPNEGGRFAIAFVRLFLNAVSAAQPIYSGSHSNLRTNGIFAHFVRNRLSSSRSFTDRRPISIDLSVNGIILTNAALDKSTCQAILGYFHHGRRLSRIRKNRIKFAIDRKSDPVSRFEAEFFPTSFLCLELKFVMKNAALSQNVNLTVT